MSYKVTEYLDKLGSVLAKKDKTTYKIPKHEEKLIIDNGFVLMMQPIKASFPFLSKNNGITDLIEVEETGIEGIKMLPRPVPVPWRTTIEARNTWKTEGGSRYIHCCPRGEDVYPKRGNLVRRGHSSEDLFNYWCNSCGYSTTDEETTVLDFLNI